MKHLHLRYSNIIYIDSSELSNVPCVINIYVFKCEIIFEIVALLLKQHNYVTLVMLTLFGIPKTVECQSTVTKIQIYLEILNFKNLTDAF